MSRRSSTSRGPPTGSTTGKRPTRRGAPRSPSPNASGPRSRSRPRDGRRRAVDVGLLLVAVDLVVHVGHFDVPPARVQTAKSPRAGPATRDEDRRRGAGVSRYGPRTRPAACRPLAGIGRLRLSSWVDLTDPAPDGKVGLGRPPTRTSAGEERSCRT